MYGAPKEPLVWIRRPPGSGRRWRRREQAGLEPLIPLQLAAAVLDQVPADPEPLQVDNSTVIRLFITPNLPDTATVTHSPPKKHESQSENRKTSNMTVIHCSRVRRSAAIASTDVERRDSARRERYIVTSMISTGSWRPDCDIDSPRCGRWLI